MTQIDWKTRATLSRLTAAEKKGYCTDCENTVTVRNGRCGCGSGRVIIAAPPSASEVHATLQAEAAETLSNTIEGGK